MNKPKTGTLENRAFNFELRAERNEEHGHFITGRPIVYESKTDIGGWFEEVIACGALDNADLKDVAFLVNHDTSKIPLARSRNNNANSTMQMSIDKMGLQIRVDLDVENNADARALYSAVQRGDVFGMSFMFRVDAEEWENLESDYPTRRITGISAVREVSAVTWAAYDATELHTDSRSALENARTALENARGVSDTLDSVNKLEVERTRMMILHNIRG
jgi:HK97 family phage prohead protease